jgi:transketolase
VTVGSGVTYGKLGYSHHAIQDIALMRSLPNTIMLCPCDPLEAQACINYILEYPAPSYLRLHKSGEPVITSSSYILPCELNFIRNNGAQKLVLSTGISAQDIHAALDDYNDYDIATLPIWNSKYSSSLVEQLLRYDLVCTYEDHLLAGGFGSWVFEQFQLHRKSLSNDWPSLICKYLGTEVIGLVGDPGYIKEIAQK